MVREGEAAEGVVAVDAVAALPHQHRYHRGAYLFAGKQVEVGVAHARAEGEG